jgi:colanic acid/amylovoran biosynthesis glycosyltransferase
VSKKTLFLFTEKFPFEGGESFLETEIQYLSKEFKEVCIYPLKRGNSYYGLLPDNVSVNHLDNFPVLRLRKIIKRYLSVILDYYLCSIFRSKNKKKYFLQFSYSWNHLMGILNTTYRIEQSEITKNREAVFYTYWFNEWTSALAICNRRGVIGRLISRAHGYDYDELQNSRGWFPFREAEIRHVNGIVQISEYGLAKMKNQHRRAPLFLSRLGVQDHGTGPVLPMEEPTFQIVSCSNFVPLKRIPLLIDVLSKLSVSFHWTHFGGGEGMEAIQQYANSKLKQTEFSFRGQVTNDEILTYYKSNPVDLFINVSELEGIPVSIMEAISFGIPVSGCNICGVPEIVVNKETGLLLDKVPDPPKTAVLLTDFLQRHSRDRGMRESVKAFWKRNFNANKNYPSFVKMLEN